MRRPYLHRDRCQRGDACVAPTAHRQPAYGRRRSAVIPDPGSRIPWFLLLSQAVASSLLEVRAVLSMPEDSVKVAQVIAWALVTMAHVFDEKASSLAVLLGFIVLLAILHQATLSMIGRVRPSLLRRLRRWRPLGSRLQRLAQPRAGLRPVVAFRVILRSWLLPGALRLVGPLLHEPVGSAHASPCDTVRTMIMAGGKAGPALPSSSSLGLGRNSCTICSPGRVCYVTPCSRDATSKGDACVAPT
jgi:hypothetical protein